MSRFLISSLLLLGSAYSFADTTDIYAPEVKRAGISAQESYEKRRGAWGFGLGYQSRDHLEASITYNLTARWFAGERWYLLGEYQHSPLSNDAVSDDNGAELEEDESSNLLAYGLGYTFMQGSAGFDGTQAFPWQLAAEVYLGEQSTGDTDGRYSALGLSWQIVDPDFWVAAGWRIYQSDDKRLEDLGMNRGAQWALYFGSYF